MGNASIPVLLVAAIGCGGAAGGDDGEVDGGEVDGDVDARSEAFALLVTESPPRSSNELPANWGGVRQFAADAIDAPIVPGPGVAADQLADPAGLAYHRGQVLIANRNGDVHSGEPVPSTIARYAYDPVDRGLTPAGAITGGELEGTHQIAVSPTTGELFAANRGGGISRFTFDEDGVATAGTQLGSAAAIVLGVAVSGDGRWLYSVSAGPFVARRDLDAGAASAEGLVVDAEGTGFLWSLTVAGQELYAAELHGAVHRLAIGDDGGLTPIDTIAGGDPMSVAVLPDGLTMFVAHGYNEEDQVHLARYVREAVGDPWSATAETIPLDRAVGAVLAVP